MLVNLPMGLKELCIFDKSPTKNFYIFTSWITKVLKNFGYTTGLIFIGLLFSLISFLSDIQELGEN